MRIIYLKKKPISGRVIEIIQSGFQRFQLKYQYFFFYVDNLDLSTRAIAQHFFLRK